MMPQTFRVLLTLVALVATAPAIAQELGSEPLAQTAATSSKEMIQGAKDALSEMNSADAEVAKDLESAEKSGDADTAECIRIQRSKIAALIAVSARAQSDMNAALASGQDARADHEYRKIKVALVKVRQFRAEALACQGEGAVADGQTEITVDSDLDDSDDTDGLGLSDGVVGTDPPNTTPFN